MFDKDKFSLLIEKALGDRTTTEYSNQSGVNRTYISKFLNKGVNNPPSPEILRRLADAAHNDVTYEDLMKAAGYIEKDKQNIKSNNKDYNELPPEEKYQKSNDFIEYVIEEAEKYGYNLRDKSKEEIAGIVIKALKIDEISKSN